MKHTGTSNSQHKNMSHGSHTKDAPYKKLFLVSVVHFIIMYLVMYTMVDRASSIYLNLNNVYMTGMMLAPMVLLMPLTMAMMYPNKKLNLWLYLGTTAVFIAFYTFMRLQTFIGDKEFLRSMIPHHSGAILMCSEAKITDLEIKKLCGEIIQGQQREVDQMKAILSRM